MFVLENGDKLQGDASAATVVDYHISGITGGTTLKNLADGQLAATIGDLYTSASTDAATTITLVNTDSVARTINLYHTPSGGTARRVIPKDLSLGAGYSVVIDGGNIRIIGTDGSLQTNVAGATLNTDADVSGNTWVVDEDDLTSDSATKVPTQQSVKAYTDSGTQTLTNKTINTASNTITIAGADVGSGTIAHERGGLEADVSAYSGLVKITGGATSAVTAPTGAIVGTTDAQTLSNKTLDDYAIEFSAIGNTGSAQTFDLETANAFSATLDQACAFTFSNPPATGNFGSFVLELTNGDAYTITFPASVDWAGGSAPTLTSSGVDILAFVTRDGGTTWHGYVMSTDSK